MACAEFFPLLTAWSSVYAAVSAACEAGGMLLPIPVSIADKQTAVSFFRRGDFIVCYLLSVPKHERSLRFIHYHIYFNYKPFYCKKQLKIRLVSGFFKDIFATFLV
jgi:hypothetical protein